MSKLQTGNFGISFISDIFKEWFGEPEIEPADTKLFEKRLTGRMTNNEVLKELKPSEITLNELIGNLPKMDKDKWYFAYIKDSGGALRVVRVGCVGWYSNSWGVYAYSVVDPHRWNAGHRVFSRNTSDTSDTLPDTLIINGVEYIKK